MKKHIIIIKPPIKSRIVSEIEEIFAGKDYEIFISNHSGHSKEITKRYRNENYRFYVFGGDGLIHEVAQNLVGTANELVVVPTGTGNDLARSIGKDMKAIDFLKRSFEQEATLIDVIQCNDVYCVNNLCCGVDSYIAQHVHDGIAGFLKGPIKYFFAAVRSLNYFDGFHTVLNYKGKEIFNDKLLVVAFCNGGYYGGGVRIGREAKLNDGFIDLNLIGHIPFLLIIRYLPALFKSDLKKIKSYYHRKIKEISFTSSIDVTIDGEKYPKGTYQVKIKEKQLRIVIYDKGALADESAD